MAGNSATENFFIWEHILHYLQRQCVLLERRSRALKSRITTPFEVFRVDHRASGLLPCFESQQISNYLQTRNSLPKHTKINLPSAGGFGCDATRKHYDNISALIKGCIPPGSVRYCECCVDTGKSDLNSMTSCSSSSSVLDKKRRCNVYVSFLHQF